jgi:hypothetical protein
MDFCSVIREGYSNTGEFMLDLREGFEKESVVSSVLIHSDMTDIGRNWPKAKV